jgi:nucleotide-binding universal stress UspA family protein
MGYYVRGKLEEAVVGSTPRRLMRRSKIPIMLVPLADGAA